LRCNIFCLTLAHCRVDFAALPFSILPGQQLAHILLRRINFHLSRGASKHAAQKMQNADVAHLGKQNRRYRSTKRGRHSPANKPKNFLRSGLRGCGDRFDRSGKAALMACGLVFVDDVFVSDGIDGRDRGLVHGFGLRFIASSNGYPHFFDCSAQFGALPHIVPTLFNSLTGALCCLFGICHVFSRLLR
jgi:hypothetical protein